MTRYETIAILDPDLTDEGRGPLLERIRGLVEQFDGFLVEVDHWGSRQLAYPIKKKTRGYYVRVDYCGTGTLVDEMERYFRITDTFLKYMTVVVEKDADIAKIQEQLEAAKAAEAPQVESPSEPTPEPTPEKQLEIGVANEQEAPAGGTETETEPNNVEEV